MIYPYILIDTNPESNTEGLYSVRWEASFQTDGYASVEEAQRAIDDSQRRIDDALLHH
jgi:hypothetical protein